MAQGMAQSFNALKAIFPHIDLFVWPSYELRERSMKILYYSQLKWAPVPKLVPYLTDFSGMKNQTEKLSPMC